MPYALPSLADLRARGRANLAARIPGADLTLRRGVLPAIADTASDLAYEEVNYLTWQLAQFFPDTASLPYLIRIAGYYGLTQKAAAPAAGSVVYTAQAGTVIPAGDLRQTSDGTVTVQTTQAATVPAGASTVTVPVLSVTAGSIANLDPGTQLTAVVAIAGASPVATVAAGGLTGGLDLEAQSSLLARLLQRLQDPPQGGDAQDYVAWAELVPGVTRAWSFPRNRGTGTIDVTAMFDARANPIPTATDIATIQAQLDALRPVVGDCVAFALTAYPVVIGIGGATFAGGITQAAGQAAIQQSLMSLFAGATPGGASVVGPGVSATYPAGLIALSQINAAIGGTSGVIRYELVTPTADLQAPAGEIVTLGGVSFQ